MDVKRGLIIIIAMGVMSCSPIPEPEVRLSKDDFKIVDSLVKVQKLALKSEIDSICNYIKEVEYQNLVDSITKVRMEYIKEIME